MAKQELPTSLVNLQEQIHTLSQRLAYVEERYKNFDGRLRQLQKNVIEHHQDARKLIRDIDKQIIQIKGTLDLFTDRLKTMRSEVLLRASKEDIEVLKKYIDVWNPFQFVTAEQVEEIVEDVLARTNGTNTGNTPQKSSSARVRQTVVPVAQGTKKSGDEDDNLHGRLK